MKKTYETPDVEYISLIPQDVIAADDDYADGNLGVESAGDLFG